MRISLLVSGGVFAAASLWGQATIAGRVEDREGKPLAGIAVTLLPRPPLTVAAGTPAGQSAGDGSFRLSGLAAGPYQICAAAPRLDYPDTCAWSAAGPGGGLVTVAAGQQLTVPAIRMAKGVRVRVNFADPSGLLERDEPRPNARLQVKIGVPGVGFTFLPVVEKGGAQRGYEMLVPRGQALKLRLLSSHFTIADGQGRTLNAVQGHDVELAAPSEGAMAPLTFRVTAAGAR
jgi:hypothetical protein